MSRSDQRVPEWIQDQVPPTPRSGSGTYLRHMPNDLSQFRTALVVEPDRDLAEIYSLLLRREGISRVVIAQTGTEALALALTRTPDLILTEVALPNLDGVALLRKLREDPRARGAAVVVITARSGALLQRHAADLGVAMLLEKPISLRTLAGTLRAGLAHFAAARPEGEAS